MTFQNYLIIDLRIRRFAKNLLKKTNSSEFQLVADGHALEISARQGKLVGSKSTVLKTNYMNTGNKTAKGRLNSSCTLKYPKKM